MQKFEIGDFVYIQYKYYNDMVSSYSETHPWIAKYLEKGGQILSYDPTGVSLLLFTNGKNLFVSTYKLHPAKDNADHLPQLPFWEE